MRKFLDPHCYLFSDSEWRSTTFIRRFKDLSQFITDISSFERERGSLFSIFVFRVSREFNSQIWGVNPFVNDPPVHNFYRQTFGKRIWPELSRRLRECPWEEVCLDNNSRPIAAPTPIDPSDPLDDAFCVSLGHCGSCGHEEPRVHFYHPDKTAIPVPSPFFAHHVAIDSAPIFAGLDPLELWPDILNRERRAEHLNDAVACQFARLKDLDPTWNSYQLQTIAFSDNFWRTLYRARFGQFEDAYRRRIINCLAQIGTGRDVDIHDHSMAPETIRIGTALHGKWNAYVFQMGPAATDRRCSRLYYAKLSDGPYIDEFEPDAH